MRSKAFLFDLHHTLTGTRESPLDITRRVATRSGLDISAFDDDQIRAALTESDKFMHEHLALSDVGIHWGSEPEHWIAINRVFFSHLGFGDLADDILIEIERRWEREILHPDFEFLTDDARVVLNELHDRGYPMGLCTRRHRSPSDLLRREGLSDFFTTVWWTAVPGYAKPSPYTLIRAADDLGINPRSCAYVGNLVDADVVAAQRAEMLPILTTWANPEEAEKASDAVLVVERITEIIDHL